MEKQTPFIAIDVERVGDDLPRGWAIDLYGLQLVPLAFVDLPGTRALLARPGASRHHGFEVPMLDVSWEGKALGLDAFRQRVSAVASHVSGMDVANLDAWKDSLARLTAFEGIDGFLFDQLRRHLSHDLGLQEDRAGAGIAFSPLARHAGTAYLERDHFSGQCRLVAAFYVGYTLKVRDLAFLAAQDLEFIPLELLGNAARLHPRYSLHPAIQTFFMKHGLRKNDAGSVLRSIPVLAGEIAETETEIISITADFSLYYRHADDPERVLAVMVQTPNPGSDEETFLHRVRDLAARHGRGTAFGDGFIRLFEDLVSRHFMRAGFFVDAPALGVFAGLQEINVKAEAGIASLVPVYPVLDIVAFFLKVEIIIDIKTVRTWGPVYHDPLRWFNLGRDRIPYDVRADLAQATRLLGEMRVPALVAGRPSDYRQQGLVLSPAAYGLFKAIADGERTGGEVALVSADDGLFGIEGSGVARKPHFVIWRRR